MILPQKYFTETKLCSFDINNMYTNSDAHAQSIMGSGVIKIPPHDLKQPSRWYYRV
jgi:hypothetical protein